MWKSTLGALVGLLVGISLGMGIAWVMHLLFPSSHGWTSYQTPGIVAEPPDPRLALFLLLGFLLGGGYGAIVGCIVAATCALTDAFDHIAGIVAMGLRPRPEDRG
jgi:hypothetical protein